MFPLLMENCGYRYMHIHIARECAGMAVCFCPSSFLTCVESDQIRSAVLMHAVLKALCYKRSYTMYIAHRVCISEKWFLEKSFLTEALYSAQ